MKKIAVILIVISMIFSVRCAYASITIYADQAAAQAEGQDGLSDFLAELSWDQSEKKLTITLYNNSSPIVDGVITRFAFNLPNTHGVANSLTLSSPDAGYASLLTGSNESPFGDFDYGVDLLNPPTYSGIAISDPFRTFNFKVDLDDDEIITELDFINELSDNKAKPGYFFLVRFQETGLDDEGSDKVPGLTRENPVPEPMTMLLFGPALLGLVGMKRKKS